MLDLLLYPPNLECCLEHSRYSIKIRLIKFEMGTLPPKTHTKSRFPSCFYERGMGKEAIGGLQRTPMDGKGFSVFCLKTNSLVCEFLCV